jgi:hypothetical protein
MSCKLRIQRGIFLETPRWHDKERFVIRIIVAILLAIWLLLVLMGKGGLVHVLLLNGIVVWIVDTVSIYRSRMTET